MRRHNPDTIIQLWCEDEARLGLKPIIRKAWATKGVRPIITQHRHYEWLHVFGFFHPTDGDSHFLLSPALGAGAMQVALDQFAEYANPTGDKIIIVLVDRASYHQTKQLKLPVGIRLYPLPPSTPELQPAECVWPLMRESIANRPISNLDRLERLLIRRCRYLMDHQEIVQQYTGFDWIVRAEGKVRKD